MIKEKNTATQKFIRSWLFVRMEAFAPRIKKVRDTLAKPYTFELEELAADLRRTLNELEDRIKKYNAS